MTEKQCPVCGKIFIATHGKQKYDCYKCSQKAYQMKRKRPPITGICVICGKEFTLQNSRQKTCGSEECKAELYREQRRKGVYCYTRPKKVADSPKKNMTASERWAKMSLREISAECARFHLTYGQAALRAQNGTLPEDFGNTPLQYTP